jgi:hypothetical protein
MVPYIPVFDRYSLDRVGRPIVFLNPFGAENRELHPQQSMVSIWDDQSLAKAIVYVYVFS